MMRDVQELLDRLTWRDMKFVLSGFCFGIAGIVIWLLFDHYEDWGTALAITVACFWSIAGGYIFNWGSKAESN